MSFEDITIVRAYNVVNGFVQFPPNTEATKSAITDVAALVAVPGSSVTWFLGGSGYPTGAKQGQQELFELPPLAAFGNWYATDPTAEL